MKETYKSPALVCSIKCRHWKGWEYDHCVAECMEYEQGEKA